MYVLPFWSYRPAGGLQQITNHITEQRHLVPNELVDLLETVHAGTATPADAPELMGIAQRADVLFAGKDAADAWLNARESRASAELPVIDQIELTNRCSYTCQMCPRTTSMDRSLGDMPLDLFEKIVRQISGRQPFVALHHFGESLLHRGLPDAVRIARDLGVRTGISCNPPTLRPELARRILEAGITNLVLSLDSLDERTYRSIRGKAARLDQADRHVRELARLRDEGGYDTAITLQMINMYANEREADAFLEYCEEVGVDRGVVVRLGRWDFDDEYAGKLGELSSPGYTAPCSLPWSSVVVLWDGRVVPCCHDYNGLEVLGDLRVDSLADVWRSMPAQRFRDRNDDAEVCRRCAFSKWFREQQRGREGFRAFHRERADDAEVRKEWFNPKSVGWRDGRQWFNRFDVNADEEER